MSKVRCGIETLVNDGSHIIYVNGKYEGDDPIGQLVSDFHQTDPNKMHYKELVAGVKYYKETEEGREIMCEAVERYGNMLAKKATKKATLNERLNLVNNLMDNMKLSLDQALNALGIQGDDREVILKRLQK